MDNILFYLAIGSIAFFVCTKLRFDLQMMQQNSYRNERYWKWLTKKINGSQKLLELLIIFAIGGGLAVGAELFIYLFLIFLLAFLAFKILKRKQKKKLVLTQRAIRLFAVSILLATFLFLLSLQFKSLSVKFISLNLVWFASPLLLLIANFLLRPIEAYNHNWYIKDAKKRLAAMPNLTIIGITGSYGKTSTKHFLHRILSEKYNVLMTPGSYNTTMGVVRTVREYLQPIHQIFIAEMGAKQRNDIKEICDIVHPKIGILTAVAEQHLDTFKTLDNVQKTKFELIDALPSNGFGVLNGDYPKIAEKKPNHTTCYFYGTTDNRDFTVQNIRYDQRGMHFAIVEKGQPILELETKLLGTYNASNILAACIVALKLGVSKKDIAYAVRRLDPVPHRLEVKRHPNGVTVIDDAFNSNPLGAKMALDVLKAMEGGKKIIITPGMIELGDKQEVYNQKFGEQIATTCDYTILVGQNQTKPIFNGLKRKQYPDTQLFIAKDLTEAVAHLQTIVRAQDIVLYENDLPDTFY